MKAQIEEILKENLSVTQCGYMNSQANLDGVKDASEIIQQLMCYREVRAFLTGMGFEYFKRFPSVSRDMILHYLQPDYNNEMIISAIAQVKSEQK